MKDKESVNHPKHYNSHPSGVECIDIIRHYCYDIGAAIKYLWRAGLKTEEGMTDRDKEIEDLRKAIWYINDRIRQLQTESSNDASDNSAVSSHTLPQRSLRSRWRVLSWFAAARRRFLPNTRIS
jgi:hypothetical protein